MTNFSCLSNVKTAYKISGMPVWAMPFVILGVGALKQWFIEDLSDTIKIAHHSFHHKKPGTSSTLGNIHRIFN